MLAGGITLAITISVASCADGGNGGTAWGDGSFDSNGERIYFTATSASGDGIDYEGGPGTGAMMMGGTLSCASCHGTDARGGTHRMHMDIMDAPNIRWVALAAEDGHTEDDSNERHHDTYDLEAFKGAVVAGVHADGEALSDDMPRWSISESDLQDLVAYLQSFDDP